MLYLCTRWEKETDISGLSLNLIYNVYILQTLFLLYINESGRRLTNFIIIQKVS